MPTEIITEQPIEYSYTASPAQVQFDFNFQIFNGIADFLVTVNGVETGAFSVTLVGEEGGYITLDTPCVGGETVVVRRQLVLERVTQFPNTGAVAMPIVNHELNRIVGMIQQLSADVGALIIGSTYNDEAARDAIAAALVDGAGIDIVADDAGNTITVNNTIDAEFIRDTIAACLVQGAGINVTVNDAANTITITNVGTGSGVTAEDVRDIIGAALVNGTGINIVVNDAGDTITINNTSGAYTAENARDDIGAALVQGTGIVITINDVGDTITVAVNTTKTLAFFIPAAAFRPRTTNGAAVGSIETATNDVNFDCLDYDQTTEEAAHVIFRMPKQVNEGGNFTAAFGWTSSIASGNARWGIRILRLADNSTLDTALSGGAEITDGHNGATKLNITARTANFTISGLTAEDLCVIEVYRDTSDAADTLAGDARLLWLDLKIPVNGFDDA